MMDKLESRKACITVIGLGHVGLPTASIFADAGFDVIGVDNNDRIIRLVSQGSSHIKEPGLSELVPKVIREDKLRVTTHILKAVKEADVIIICVQTPVTKDKKPDLTYLKNVCETVSKGVTSERNKLIIVGSTVPPATTKSLVVPILEKGSGLKCGEDFRLAYCPERVLPGKALEELVKNVKIIGGYDSTSSELAAMLYKAINKSEVFITDCTTAEVAKLAENTFRDVNIAFANELALICEGLNVDVTQVINLANTHPRVNIHKPGCGVGGPCIPKDPYLLLHPVELKGFNSKIIRPARELNDYMPKHTVKLVIEALKQAGKEVEDSKVVILGVSYKGEVDDTRNSPAKVIIHELEALKADVIVYDPYCKESFGAKKARNIYEGVKHADCLVIVTDHKIFKRLDFQKIKKLMNEKPVIVDGKGLFDFTKIVNEYFSYFAVGCEA